MDVLLIKSIENTYIAPVLIEQNLEMVNILSLLLWFMILFIILILCSNY